MQILILFVYDELCCVDKFKHKFPNIKILRSEYAFTHGLLRYNNGKYYLYTSKRSGNIIFGRYYELEVEDSDIEDLSNVHIMYKQEEIDVTILKDVEDITTCKFLIDKKARASIFVGCYIPLRGNRKVNVGNVSKYLLI